MPKNAAHARLPVGLAMFFPAGAEIQNLSQGANSLSGGFIQGLYGIFIEGLLGCVYREF